MAEGSFGPAGVAEERAAQYQGRVTPYVIIACIVAAIGGSIFGYDIGISAFGWSWGPLGWTVPSEIFPLETRSAGQSITVAVNLFFTFIIGQSFLSLLCAFKFGIFLFFAGWITVMTIFVYLFLPETKGVPIEEMIFLWRKHWFWKKIVPTLPQAGESKKFRTDSL